MKTTPEQEQMLLDSLQVLRDPEEIALARAVCTDLATLRALEGGGLQTDSACGTRPFIGLEGQGGTDHE